MQKKETDKLLTLFLYRGQIVSTLSKTDSYFLKSRSYFSSTHNDSSLLADYETTIVYCKLFKLKLFSITSFSHFTLNLLSLQFGFLQFPANLLFIKTVNALTKKIFKTYSKICASDRSLLTCSGPNFLVCVCLLLASFAARSGMHILFRHIHSLSLQGTSCTGLPSKY